MSLPNSTASVERIFSQVSPTSFSHFLYIFYATYSPIIFF